MGQRYGLAPMMLLTMLVCVSGTAFAEAPSFDPDQPFRQAFNSTLLRAMLNRTLDLIEEHIEVAGDMAQQDSRGEQQGRFSVKVLPRGKSQSDEHAGAEGWFRFSPDLGRQDFHLRFQSPQKESSHGTARPDGAL